MADHGITSILRGGYAVIDPVSAAWTELCDEGASGAPFLRPEWFSVFVKNFAKSIELLTVTVDNKLRAILPVERRSGILHGIPARKLQAVFNLNTPRFDLIHGRDETERKAVVKAIWETIRDRSDWDVVETRLVRRDSWLADVVELAEREGYRTGIWKMDGAPFITLPNSEDKKRAIVDFFGSSRKHLRQELDRRLRRLRELGEVEFIVTPGCSEQLLKTYFDLEALGWKGRGGTAVTDDPNVVRLHEDFANEVAARNALFVYELRFNGTTIAMSMNIRDGDTMIHWKTSYDEEYSRYAPGNLLFRQLLSDCIQAGLAEIDFLSPSTPNKRTWATGERDHVAFYIFRRGLLGSLLWTWKFRIVGGFRSLRSRTTFGMRPAHAHK